MIVAQIAHKPALLGLVATARGQDPGTDAWAGSPCPPPVSPGVPSPGQR